MIVIHAENAIPIAVRRVMKNRVGRKGAAEDFRFSIIGFRLQLLQGWNDYVGLFFAEGAGFAGMRIEAGDGDARSGQSALTKEILEQQADADDLFASQLRPKLRAEEYAW